LTIEIRQSEVGYRDSTKLYVGCRDLTQPLLLPGFDTGYA